MDPKTTRFVSASEKPDTPEAHPTSTANSPTNGATAPATNGAGAPAAIGAGGVTVSAATGNGAASPALLPPSDHDPRPPIPSVPCNGGVGATLLGAAAFLLSVAAAATVAGYVALPADAGPDWWQAARHLLIPVGGVLVAVVGGLLFSGFNKRYTAPDRMDPGGHGHLYDRLNVIDARLHTLCGAAPAPGAPTLDATGRACCVEGWAHRNIVAAGLQTTGERWVSGTGFVELWRHIHAAEAALIVVEPRAEAVGDALFDEMRLKGSTIKNSEDLLAKLRNAVRQLEPDAYHYLTPATPPVAEAAAVAPSPLAEMQARVVLRDVRRMISGFRDDKWEGLVRSRNRLIWTGTCTGLAAFALLALAVLQRVPPDAIVATSAFYLVGAIVGLFNQLRRDAKNQSADEDFGFAKARLLYVPMLSGIAGVVGVVVAALLYAAADSVQIMYPAPVGGTTDVAPTARVVPNLMDIFDLSRNHFGLLVAAVFGLTPDLLVDRLQKQADGFRAELNSTSAHETATSGTA